MANLFIAGRAIGCLVARLAWGSPMTADAPSEPAWDGAVLQRMDAADLLPFWAHVNRHPTSGDCWEWTGRRHPRTGHGKLTFGGRQWATHRLAYALAYGPIPPGMIVMHMCANPPCCNPAHLKLGTNADLAERRRQRPRNESAAGMG